MVFKMNTVLVVVISSFLCLVSAEDYKRVCYYSNWSQYRPGAGKYFPVDIDPTLCTHLIYSFAKLDTKHELAPYEWNDISVLYKAFNDFKVGTNIKTLLAVGGWNAGSKLFSEMVSSNYLREKFARQAVQFIVKHEFDGLDLDWEYPANRDGSKPSDKQNFIILLEDIRKAMINQGQGQLLLTAAVSAGQSTIDTAYDIPAMAANLDFINLMSYDLNGAWDDTTGHNSPLYSRAAETTEQKKRNVDWAAKYWVMKGTPKEKLIIGLATYGRHFTLSDLSNNAIGAPASGPGTPGPMTREPGFLAYYEICAMIAQGAVRTWDEEHKVPYLVLGNQWVGYDDELSFMIKLNYIMDNSYGGAMIWNIDLDDFNYQCSNKESDRYPLMSLMRDLLGDYTPTTREPVTGGTTDGPIVTDRPTNPPGELTCIGVTNYAYLADPDDCSVYHRCVYGELNTYQCTNGLLWNTDRNYCDYPVNVDCVSGTTEPPTSEPTTEPPTTKPTTNPPTTSPTTAPPTTKPTTAPPTTKPTTAPPTTSPTTSTNYKRVCYYSNWSQYRPGAGKYFPVDIDPTLCTHLIYSFAKLDTKHELAPYEWNDISVLYKAFNEFKVGTNIKTLLAVGGWNAGSKLFSEMVSSNDLRAKFARQAVQFIVKHEFDGLDLDWEYPANRDGSKPSDKENFIILLEDIRKAMINQGQGQLLLTAAVSAGQSTIDTAYDIPAMAANLDFINLMSYDLNGAWDDTTGHNSPLYSRAAETTEQKKRNVDWAAKYWVMKGTPKEKLIIGLATYGRHFTLSDLSNNAIGAPASGPGTPGPMTREPGFLAYYEICAMIAQGAVRTWDEEHKVPYLVLGNQWVGYDDELSFMIKLNYIMDNSYGGAMIWNIDLDDFNYQCSNKESDRYPLMSLMRDLLGDYTPTTREPVTGGTTDGPIVTDRPTNPPGELTCIGVTNYAYLADPDDCSVYHRCVHGVLNTYQCTNGLLWNTDREYCDYPVNVNCVSGTTEPPTTERTTAPPTTKPTTAPPTTEPTTKPPTTKPTTKPPTTTKSPTVPPTSGFCADKTNGLYKKVDDCQSFYNCAYGRTTIITCTAGTLFNAEAKTCDWSRNVDCDEQEPETDFCAGRKARLYGYPEDCSKYYKCDGTSNTAILTCPANQYFNIKGRKCDWKQNVKCGKRPQPESDGDDDDEPVDMCATNGDGLYADPDDCHDFIQCAHGVKYPKTCGSLAFNPKLSICDWPANVLTC